MARRSYTVEEVAGLLGLHVKTVRAYVRDGRLKAVRIGRRYRITQEDLEAFTGYPVEPPAREPAPRRRVEASTVVRLDAIGPEEMSRLSALLTAGAAGRSPGGGRLWVETVYDEERAGMKVVILGGPAETAELLKMIDALVGEQP